MNGKIIKFLLAAIFISFNLAQASAQTCAPAPIGLISSYSAENNALDARSRNNGATQGNVSYVSGKVGQAFQLGGTGDTSGNGDRVSTGNPANLRLQEFTIEAWIKRSSSTILTNSPSGGSPNGTIFAYGQNGWGILIDQPTNKLAFSGIGNFQINSNLTITDTNWHHVAVEITGVSGQVLFYLDGVADTPFNGTNTPYSYTTNAAIGARGDNNLQNAFFGAIDELAIYNRPLAASEIQSIYNSGTTGKCKPIATYAPDNQVLWLAGDGDARDSAGANDGSLQNGANFAVGKVGQGFNFDGADDQISVPHNANQNGGSNLSIEAWINPTALPHGGTILQKRTAGNIGGYVLEPTQPSGGGSPNGLQFVIMIGGVYQTLNPSNVLNTNVWQHVAATYDGAFMRIYVNGAEVANKAQTGAIDAVNAPIVIGRNVVNNFAYQGGIDEIAVYNRSLTAAEIQSIANAGLGGKYKVQSTVPTGITAWYSGDGNANDLQAANNGTLMGGATYAPGKVGQALSLNGTNAYIQAASTAANDPTGNSSIEAWFNLNQLPSAAGHHMLIVSKSSNSGTDGFDLVANTNGFIYFSYGGSFAFSANTSLQTGVWYHVVGTFDTVNGVRIYINGKLENSSNSFNPRTASGQPFQIGSSTVTPGLFFNGLIDEPTIYNRALTANEIRDLYYAQSGGKYKAASVPTFSNKVKTGDIELTFNSITDAGAVQQTPLNLSSLPPLPAGAVSAGLTYDISTSFLFSGQTTLCLKLPALTLAQFSNLGILHLENGVWIDRGVAKNSANRTICASPPTLSPFAVAQVLNPTSATVSIGGRVTLGKGTGIANARLILSGSKGETRMAITNPFGFYQFDDIAVGETYILTISAKRYQFEPSTQILTVTEELSDVDFRAFP